MKNPNLKSIIKEEIIKVLSEDNTMGSLSDLTPGKYKIEYKSKDNDEVGFSDITIDVTSNDIEMDGDVSIQNFINSEVKEGKVISIKSVKKIG